MPQRLRVPVAALVEGEAWLDEATSRYVARVHRRVPGDALVVFDPDRAEEADATIVRVEPRRVRCRIGQPRPAARLGSLPVVLLQALGKGDKPEDVIRDATALGARAVVLVESSRSVPKLTERGDARRARWREVAVQAARQSGRGDIPALDGPHSFAEALARLDPSVDRRFVLSPGARTPLLAALEAEAPDVPGVLLVGPEGGFTDDELGQAEAHGFERVAFGALVLRTETAATAALGAWLAWRESRLFRADESP